jgi:hypothetical protein
MPNFTKIGLTVHIYFVLYILDIYMCVYIYIYIYVCVHIYIYINVCVCVCVCAWVCIHRTDLFMHEIKVYLKSDECMLYAFIYVCIYMEKIIVFIA